MKKLLTFVLILVAAAVLISFGAAQQARQEQPGGALSVSQPSAQPIEPLAGLEGGSNPAAMDRATNGTGVPPGPEAMLKKSCNCIASTQNWDSPNIYNYGTIKQYDTFDTKAPKKCSDECSKLVSARMSIEDATTVCEKTKWTGGCVHGYGYIGSVGTKKWDGTAGLLVCTAPVAEVMRQKCPQGWTCNGCSPQVDGGFTSDGKCKKLACQASGITYPPSGTQIGSWGFSSGNGFYEWGTSYNGGVPDKVIVTPAIPGSGSWGKCL